MGEIGELSSLAKLSSPTPSIIKPVKSINLLLLAFFSIIYWFELRVLDIEHGIQKFLSLFSLGNPGLRILWHIMHLTLSLWFFLSNIIEYIKSFLIASQFLKKYETLDVSKVQYLAIVFDSEEARQSPKVIELLQWLVNIGVEKVCLYDSEGVLKKYKKIITDNFIPENNVLVRKKLDIEFISFSDGKEAVVKAANYLYTNHYASIQKERVNFTEPQMGEALKAVGSGGQEPDLLLIYGPTRCHYGFPAWRLRYTEMVHMGTLKSTTYGALVKAIYRFTTVQQNYGT